MKSEFEKWWNKKGVISGSYETASEKAWLAALQWALSKCQAVKLAGDYYLNRVISEETVDAEIKKLKSKVGNERKIK